ncbi:MAG TPA: Ig-like domain-containing protein [Gemmatimonadaceae bacterium]
MIRPSWVVAATLVAAAFGCGSDSTVAPPTANVVTKVSGDGQQVLLGQTAPAPLVVSVTDANGGPLAGVQVNWRIVSGGGTLSSSSSTTDQSGNASVTWTFGQSGAQSVKAWTDAPGAPSVTFSTAPVTQLMTIVSGDGQKGPFDVALPVPLVVSVTTPSGTPIPNVKVNWGVAAGEGSVSSTSSTTDQTGKASVTWTLGPTYLNQTVKAWTDTEGSQSDLFSATGQLTLVLHYDGTSWTRSLNTENVGMSLNAGWAASPSIAFAAGHGCHNPPAVQYNNGVWSGMDTCEQSSLSVTSVWGTAPNDIWAVASGGQGRIMDPPLAWVFHFDGSNWTFSYTDSLVDLVAIGTRSTDDVIAVGRHGRIVRHAGSQWLQQTSGTASDLFAVWGDPNSTSVFAVGAAGTVVAYDGAAWGTQTSGTTAPLRSVWGSSVTDVFAVGDNGTILHFDGASWTAQSSGTTQNLRGVWGSAPNSVFAVGAGGTILRYDGVRWTAQSPGVQMAFTSVWGTSASNVFVAGR